MVKLDKVYSIMFSPTGTSRRVASAVIKGLGVDDGIIYDLTCNGIPATTLPSHSLAVFAVPVYGGNVAPLALKRLEALRGKDTPAILIAVYGNRAYGKALEELSAFVSERGFISIAVAAFVGEHSYSTDEYPIAVGRPDAADIDIAVSLGQSISKKLSNTEILMPVDMTNLKHPRNQLVATARFIWFVLGQRRKQKKNPIKLLPVTDSALCIHCGKCVTLCPNQAIVSGDELNTNSARCIRCCACVKGCPTAARKLQSPYARILSQCFKVRKEPVFAL